MTSVPSFSVTTLFVIVVVSFNLITINGFHLPLNGENVVKSPKKITAGDFQLPKSISKITMKNKGNSLMRQKTASTYLRSKNKQAPKVRISLPVQSDHRHKVAVLLPPDHGKHFRSELSPNAIRVRSGPKSTSKLFPRRVSLPKGSFRVVRRSSPEDTITPELLRQRDPSDNSPNPIHFSIPNHSIFPKLVGNSIDEALPDLPPYSILDDKAPDHNTQLLSTLDPKELPESSALIYAVPVWRGDKREKIPVYTDAHLESYRSFSGDSNNKFYK